MPVPIGQFVEVLAVPLGEELVLPVVDEVPAGVQFTLLSGPVVPVELVPFVFVLVCPAEFVVVLVVPVDPMPVVCEVLPGV